MNVRGCPPPFIAQVGWFGGDKLGNHHKLPLGALMAPPVEGGHEDTSGGAGCGRTLAWPERAHLQLVTSYEPCDLAHGGFPRS